jgi:hypothetical protein
MKSMVFIFAFVLIQTVVRGQVSCEPHITLEHQVARKLPVEDAALCDMLKVKCPGGNESDWQVESFQLVNVPRHGDPVVSVNTGSDFSADTKAILKKVKVDDILFFENIKLKQLSTGAQVERALVIEVY